MCKKNSVQVSKIRKIEGQLRKKWDILYIKRSLL